MPTYKANISTNASDNIITRYTTPTLIMRIGHPDLEAAQIKSMNVTIAQGRTRIVKNYPHDVWIDDGLVYTTLSQTETGSLFNGLCDIQLHGKMKNNSAWQTTVREMYVYGSSDRDPIDDDELPSVPSSDLVWEDF